MPLLRLIFHLILVYYAHFVSSIYCIISCIDVIVPQLPAKFVRSAASLLPSVDYKVFCNGEEHEVTHRHTHRFRYETKEQKSERNRISLKYITRLLANIAGNCLTLPANQRKKLKVL